jgi:hypothetical protein
MIGIASSGEFIGYYGIFKLTIFFYLEFLKSE